MEAQSLTEAAVLVGRPQPLDEDGVEHLLAPLMDGTPFVVLSAYRRGNNLEESRQRTAELIHDFRAQGLGGLQFYGPWTELDEQDQKVHYPATVFVLVNDPKAEGPGLTAAELFFFAVEMMRKYEQAVVVWHDGEELYSVRPAEYLDFSAAWQCPVGDTRKQMLEFALGEGSH